MKKNDGFTLIELLITTSILAFMIGAMTIVLLQQQRQFNLTREAVDIDQTGRSILNFIATEVRNTASRQGKNFSFDFVNGGSVALAANRCINNTPDTGTVDSPPDCLTTFTWDITRGINNSLLPGVTRLPSIPFSIEISSKSSGDFSLRLPDLWFDGTNFIGENQTNPTILVGLRSRLSLCNPNPAIFCENTPELCGECSVIIEGTVNDATRTIQFNNLNNIIKTNFPITLGSIDQFINGVPDPRAADPAKAQVFGLTTFTTAASEMTIVNSKTFRVDPVDRELQLSINGGNFQPIAGGQENTLQGLESVGIADLQFVFNLQNPDGSISKVGYCEGTNCNDTNSNIFSDFNEISVQGREQDIRSVEIFLVLKSKTKPQSLSGNQFTQTIPDIADVDTREVNNQSTFNEPEEGFIYRVYSTTIYPRNMAREEFG